MPVAETLPQAVGADLDLLLAAAEEAAGVALGYFRSDPKDWLKDNASPVSEADMAVDRLLFARLAGARPDYGWISEESAGGQAQRGETRSFVVDPIDGTRGFLEGRTDWTISLAVVAEGRPVAAALAAPARGELFSAVRGGGAWRNGARLAAAPPPEWGELRLAGPRRDLGPFAEASGIPRNAIRFVGSLAYRLTLVAAGEADLALSRPGARDWDLAAADLLVHEAGAVLADLEGRTVRYGGACGRHPAVMAGVAALHRKAAGRVAAAVDRIAAERGKAEG